MKCLIRIGLALAWLLWLGVAPLTAAEATRPPNIVFILVDDLGWADVACNGSKFYQTPNIDRLARDGMRFTQAYAAAPICSPTRASILTGRSPARLHMTDWLPGRNDRPDQKLRRPAILNALPLEELTLAETLKTAGYATAHIGKWHLGGEGFSPLQQGYDVNIAGNQAGSPETYFAPFKQGQGFMPGLESSHGSEYLTDRLTDEALKFIEANQKRPFFVMLSHYAVHIPLSGKTNLMAKYQRAAVNGAAQTNAIYAAMIESVDGGVGRLMAKLEKLKLARDTVVIFTSDNGGLSVREGPSTPATSNAPLRDGKGYLHEGGIRVPLILRYPRVIPAGAVASAPVSSLDFFPTLVALTGATLPAASLDGASLAPLWKQPGQSIHENLFWHYPHYSNQGGHPAGAIREGDLKLIENYESGYLELYNIASDIGETNNLAQQMPQRANELQKKLADWRRSIGARTNTLNPDYVPVPIGPRADGTIVLAAHDVTIHGVNVRYEPPAHKNTIGYWTRVEDWVSWAVRIDRAGTYQVEVLQGCGKGSGNSEVEISLGDQKVEFVVQDTGGFQNFVRRQVGELAVPAAGHYTLAVRPHKKPGVAVMDLRELVLRPLGK